MQDHRQLAIWVRSMDYVVRVHVFTAQLPG